MNFSLKTMSVGLEIDYKELSPSKELKNYRNIGPFQMLWKQIHKNTEQNKNLNNFNISRNKIPGHRHSESSFVSTVQNVARTLFSECSADFISRILDHMLRCWNHVPECPYQLLGAKRSHKRPRKGCTTVRKAWRFFLSEVVRPQQSGAYDVMVDDTSASDLLLNPDDSFPQTLRYVHVENLTLLALVALLPLCRPSTTIWRPLLKA